MSRPFKFIHASDLHLDEPMEGLAEVPEHLRETLVDAAFTAAQRIFDAALSEEVAFLVFSGNVIRLRLAGARGLAFLSEQFARMASRGVLVFWIAGESELNDTWPEALPLPDGIHVLPQGRSGEFLVQRDGVPIARVICRSHDGMLTRAADFLPSALDGTGGLFTVAVAHGEFASEQFWHSMQSQAVNYWALGGRAERATLFTTPSVAHYAGTHQGRHPDESGPHGCTLVEVVDSIHAHPSFLPVDAVRWITERIVVDPGSSKEGIESLLLDRVHALAKTHGKTDLLIHWLAAGRGPLFDALRHGKLCSDLLDWLRVEFGVSSPAAWSVQFDLEEEEHIPLHLKEQETILGDFLRSLEKYDEHQEWHGEPLPLDRYLPESHVGGLGAGLHGSLSALSAADRIRIVHEAAILGIQLLGGEHPS
jgi:hypothetical protein